MASADNYGIAMMQVTQRLLCSLLRPMQQHLVANKKRSICLFFQERVDSQNPIVGIGYRFNGSPSGFSLGSFAEQGYWSWTGCRGPLLSICFRLVMAFMCTLERVAQRRRQDRQNKDIATAETQTTSPPEETPAHRVGSSHYSRARTRTSEYLSQVEASASPEGHRARMKDSNLGVEPHYIIASNLLESSKTWNQSGFSVSGVA